MDGVPFFWEGPSTFARSQSFMKQGMEHSQAVDLANGEKYGSAAYRELRFDERERSNFDKAICPLVERLGADAEGNVAVIAGVNAGQDVQYLPQSRIVGVDPCSEAIKVARLRYPQHRFENAMSDRLPLESQSVDAYLALATVGVSTFEMMKSIDEMIRVLKPRAPFIFSVSCGIYVGGVLRPGTVQDGKIDPDYWRGVMDKLRKCLADRGLASAYQFHPLETLVYGTNTCCERLANG